MQRSKSFRPQEHCGQVTFYNDLYKVLTNIPFHMQNLGPVWKVFVLARMGVDIPVAGVKSILQAQVHWEDNCVNRCTKDKLHKRYACSIKFQLKKEKKWLGMSRKK